MSKATSIASFDPNAPGAHDAQLFGLPFSAEEADLILVPVPWEVTTSYGGGTSAGPEAIRQASLQVDLFSPEYPDLWKRGIWMDEIPGALLEQSRSLKKEAQRVIDALVGGKAKEQARAAKALTLVNEECAVMNEWVRQRTAFWLDQGKRVGLLGGDHSTPLGFLHTLAERHEGFGILHIDAHMDLRAAYEGFTYSHASIMYNALKLEAIERLVMVGIRDLCEAEARVFKEQAGRVRLHRAPELRRQQFEGATWKSQCDAIVEQLPQEVYISFDIDGLDPTLCPSTGTPVPGGLGFDEAIYLLRQVVESGRRIIGFDLVEVAPGPTEWDANVGARMLWNLCGALAASK